MIKIEFKLTPARKIEIRLTDSTNKRILYHYYYALNGLYVRGKSGWIYPDIDWFPAAQRIYKEVLERTKSRWQANIQTCKYIWTYYKNRPNSEVLSNGINYNSGRHNVILFYGYASDSNTAYWQISFQPGPYSIYVSPESNWYKKKII